MPTKHSNFRRRMMALADGGHVRGPGTGTSDSIPARLSDGEFVLPADTVRKVGVNSLRDLVDTTHKPSGQPAHPARFADGGLASVKREDYVGNAFKAMDQQRDAATRLANEAAASAQAESEAAAPVASGGPATPGGAGSMQSMADRIAQIPTDGPKAPAADGSQNSWANTDAGRNLANAAAALPGVASAVPTIARTGGAISSGLNAVSRLMNVGAATARDALHESVCDVLDHA